MSDQEVVIEENHNAKNTPAVDDIGAEVVNLSQSVANTIKAELVRINQGGAEKIIATEMELKQGAANRIEAQQVILSDSVVGLVQTAGLDLKDSAAGIVRAESIDFTQSGVGVVYSQAVDMKEETRAGLVFARQISGEKINTKLLLAGNVDGQIETVMDTRQALLAGLSAGFVLGISLLIGQVVSRRK